jgi:hypothetical protein
VAAASAAALILGLAGIPAHAEPEPTEATNAVAQALDIALADQDVPTDLLSPAIAEQNPVDNVTTLIPLDLAPLEDLGLGVGSADLLGNEGLLILGALNQVASADTDGALSAAAGAVSDTGNIDIPAAPTPEESGAALSIGTDTVGLGDALDLTVDVGGLASTAELPAAVDGAEPRAVDPTGTWEVSDLGIELGGSQISDIASQIDGAVSPVADQLSTLGGLLGVDVPEIDNPLADGTLPVSEEDVLEAAEVDSLTDLPAGTDLLGFLPDAVVNALNGVNDDLVAQIADIVGQLQGSPEFDTVCNPPLLPPNPLCAVLDTAVETVADSLDAALATIVDTALGALADTAADLLALPVGTETLGDDGSFAVTALTAVLGPDGQFGQLDMATSSIIPNTATPR